jgi:hypothetical protein
MRTVKNLQKARAKLADNRASLASKIIRWFSRKSLRWLERQIGNEFDRELSLKIDKVITRIEYLEQENEISEKVFWLARAWESVKKSCNSTRWRLQPRRFKRVGKCSHS